MLCWRRGPSRVWRTSGFSSTRLVPVLRTEPSAARTHASWRPGRAAGRSRLSGSVRPEPPERTVTMSCSTGPTESLRQYRPPSRAHTDPHRRQLRPPGAGCPGEREGWWHRRTLSWRTLSGVRAVSPARGSGARVRVPGSDPHSAGIILCVNHGGRTRMNSLLFPQILSVAELTRCPLSLRDVIHPNKYRYRTDSAGTHAHSCFTFKQN